MDENFLLEFQRAFGRVEQKVDDLRLNTAQQSVEIRSLSERLGAHERTMAERSRKLSDTSDILVATASAISVRVEALESADKKTKLTASERAMHRRKMLKTATRVVGGISTACVVVWAVVEPFWHAAAEHVTKSILDHKM